MSLIEVLVAALLISFGLLGLISLQSRTAQFSVGTEDRLRASILANEIATEMWSANSVTLDAAVIEAWNKRVSKPEEAGLPNGEGTVAIAGGVARITVKWRAPNAAVGDWNTYITDVMIAAP